jgi:hypothetical protein
MAMLKFLALLSTKLFSTIRHNTLDLTIVFIKCTDLRVGLIALPELLRIVETFALRFYK